MRQGRIPLDRARDAAPICEIEAQGVGRDVHGLRHGRPVLNWLRPVTGEEEAAVGSDAEDGGPEECYSNRRTTLEG